MKNPFKVLESYLDNYLSSPTSKTSYSGRTVNYENQAKRIYDSLSVDPDTRTAIAQIRLMDRTDPRVKRINKRMAADIVRGGIKIEFEGEEDNRIRTQWQSYSNTIGLKNAQRLHSHAKLLVKEGNLPLQWVYDDANLVACYAMPADSIIPNVLENGQFKNSAQAYFQKNELTGAIEVEFPLYKLSLARLDPDNFDDKGCMGRPYLDSARKHIKMMDMMENDIVVRRRSRAPLKLLHTLKGASEQELEEYERKNKHRSTDIAADFYSASDASIQALQGDANLDQMQDVFHILNTLFSCAPGPKGLFGYEDGLNRDILEDLKIHYYEEIDTCQDILASAYQEGFFWHLAMQGINPNAYNYTVKFAERRTETPNKRADRALKIQALGASERTTFEVAGLDPDREKSRRKKEAQSRDYPKPSLEGGAPRVSVTPGNAKKSESATSIGHK